MSPVTPASSLIDVRVRAGDVDDDRRRDRLAAVERRRRDTRPASRSIAVTVRRNRKSAPWWRAAWARLWAASIGSSMYPLTSSKNAVSSLAASSLKAGSSIRFGGQYWPTSSPVQRRRSSTPSSSS